MLLHGVLNLVGKLVSAERRLFLTRMLIGLQLSGLGLDSLLKGLFAATGLKSIAKAAGLDKMLNF